MYWDFSSLRLEYKSNNNNFKKQKLANPPFHVFDECGMSNNLIPVIRRALLFLRVHNII